MAAEDKALSAFNLVKVDATIVDSVDMSAVLFDVYGLKVASMKRMSGFIDLTFKVVDADGKSFIFKVFIDTYSTDINQVEAEIAMMQHLRVKHNLPVPELATTKSGKLYHVVHFPASGKNRPIRLQPYCNGIKVAELGKGKLYVNLCEQIGDLMGRVDAALVDFHHPFYVDNSSFLIKMNDLPSVRDMLKHVKDEKQQQQVIKVLDLYDEHVVKHQDNLPKQVIHCDGQVYNILADEAGQSITYLIDFSDARQTLRIIELGIIIPSVLGFGAEPENCVKALLEGYGKHVKLNQYEVNALLPTAMTRVVQSLVINSYLQDTVANFNQGYIAGTMEIDLLLSRLLDDDYRANLQALLFLKSH